MKKTVLFTGDSVTDCGRNRHDEHSLGSGYPSIIASALEKHTELVFYNTGVSGSRIRDLNSDSLQCNPDVLSVLIGVNDVWRRFDQNDSTSPEDFERDYRRFLTLAREKNSALEIILLEPFIIPAPGVKTNATSPEWREDLDPKIHIVRALAVEFNARLIPLDGIFAAASTYAPARFWAADGVHPGINGHKLIAKYWLKTCGYYETVDICL